MDQAIAAYTDRKKEILSYLELVEGIERSLQVGTPVLKIGESEYKIVPLQQRILYAGIYLHLYNLVESTVTLLVEEIERAALDNVRSNAWELSGLMRQQWVRSTACTYDQFLNAESRLERAVLMCEQLVGMLPFDIKIHKGGGGNWDDEEIESLAKRLGVNLVFPKEIWDNVKRPSRDNKGAMKLIRDLRNKLAHGSITFSECGNDHVVRELRSLAETTFSYMDTVIDAFKHYIDSREYLEREVHPNLIEQNAQELISQ